MSDDSGPPSKAARFTPVPSAKAHRRLRSYSCGEFFLPALVPTPPFVCCRFKARGISTMGSTDSDQIVVLLLVENTLGRAQYVPLCSQGAPHILLLGSPTFHYCSVCFLSISGGPLAAYTRTLLRAEIAPAGGVTRFAGVCGRNLPIFCTEIVCSLVERGKTGQ